MGTMNLLRDMRVGWGHELPGLPLNYFADAVPAAFHEDRSLEAVRELSVLSRQEGRARTRRGCYASRVSYVETMIYWASNEKGRRPGKDWFDAQLPAGFVAQYDVDFYSQLHSHVTGIWDRMQAGTFDAPRTTAEEILIGIILNHYLGMLAAEGLKPGYVDLDELWLQDDDYLLLYDVELKLARNPKALRAMAREIDAVNLDFASWFVPFRAPTPDPVAAPARRTLVRHP